MPEKYEYNPGYQGRNRGNNEHFGAGYETRYSTNQDVHMYRNKHTVSEEEILKNIKNFDCVSNDALRLIIKDIEQMLGVNLDMFPIGQNSKLFEKSYKETAIHLLLFNIYADYSGVSVVARDRMLRSNEIVINSVLMRHFTAFYWKLDQSIKNILNTHSVGNGDYENVCMFRDKSIRNDFVKMVRKKCNK